MSRLTTNEVGFFGFLIIMVITLGMLAITLEYSVINFRDIVVPCTLIEISIAGLIVGISLFKRILGEHRKRLKSVILSGYILLMVSSCVIVYSSLWIYQIIN